MSVAVLTGFAGVLVAAVATGMLAGRCVRQPRIAFIVWAAAALALTIALTAQSIGFARGFSPVTFRAVQLFGFLVAPLWLAWGLVELVAAHEAARFGMRLVAGALTVLGSMVLATDPLTAQLFSKAWPLTGRYYQPISYYVLDAVQAVAVLATVVSVALAAARARREPRWRPAMAAVVPVAVAVLLTAGLRFPLPDRVAYPLFSMVAAALVWLGASRVREPPGTSRDGRKGGVRKGRGRYRSAVGPDGDRPDDPVPAGSYDPAGDYPPEGQYATYGQRDGEPGPGRTRDGPGVGPAARTINGAGPAARTMNGAAQGRHASPGPRPRTPGRPDPYRGSGPGGPAADERQLTMQAAGQPGTLAADAAPPGSGPYGPGRSQQAGPGGSPAAAAPPRPHGRILIFTLLEDRVADFDRLAEQTAEEVRKGEPGTLVYVIHLVPNAPMQRIFYEIYRDRAAFDSHESQPYMQRFVAEHRSYVLATNVIELRLKYAKVAPLPSSPQRPAPAQARPPAGAWAGAGPSGPQRYQLPPPAPPQRPGPGRYGYQRPDHQWPEQQRPDQGWPDQRQAPSADPRYDG